MLNKYKLVVFFLKLFRWVELLSLRGAAEVPGDEGNVSLGQSSLPSNEAGFKAQTGNVGSSQVEAGRDK